MKVNEFIPLDTIRIERNETLKFHTIKTEAKWRHLKISLLSAKLTTQAEIQLIRKALGAFTLNPIQDTKKIASRHIRLITGTLLSPISFIYNAIFIKNIPDFETELRNRIDSLQTDDLYSELQTKLNTDEFKIENFLFSNITALKEKFQTAKISLYDLRTARYYSQIGLQELFGTCIEEKLEEAKQIQNNNSINDDAGLVFSAEDGGNSMGVTVSKRFETVSGLVDKLKKGNFTLTDHNLDTLKAAIYVVSDIERLIPKQQ